MRQSSRGAGEGIRSEGNQGGRKAAVGNGAEVDFGTASRDEVRDQDGAEMAGVPIFAEDMAGRVEENGDGRRIRGMAEGGEDAQGCPVMTRHEGDLADRERRGMDAAARRADGFHQPVRSLDPDGGGEAQQRAAAWRAGIAGVQREEQPLFTVAVNAGEKRRGVRRLGSPNPIGRLLEALGPEEAAGSGEAEQFSG